MNEKVGKERLQKIDRFADSCAFSKALGNQAEFMKLIGNVISITKNTGLKLSDVEEFVEKSKEIPHYAVRRAAWVLSKFTQMRFIGMEVIPYKSKEPIWPSPLLSILKQRNYKYSEKDELTLKGFYSKYKASIGTSKIDLIYESATEKIIRLIEVKSYGEQSGEFKLKDEFSDKDLEQYIKKSDDLYKQLVFVSILPSLISLEGYKISSYYYMKPENSKRHRFFEVIRKAGSIDDILKDKNKVSLKEDTDLSFTKEIDYSSMLYSGSLGEIYKTIPLCEGVRTIWILIYFFKKQKDSNDLVIFKRREMAKLIEEELKTIMTSDIQRHDFEDQLERRGYIGRIGSEKDVCYFVTPSGLFRGYYYLSKIENFDFSKEDFLELIHYQAQRISERLGWL